MIRPTLYVFSKCEFIKDSISRFIRYIGIKNGKLMHEFDPQRHAKTYTYLEEITSILNKEQPEALLNTVVIMDISDVYEDISYDLNPISSSNTTGQILSSLILAYPEIYWIILGTSYNKPSDNVIWAKEHFVDAMNMLHCIELLQNHQNGYRPLYDPSGLKSWIKQSTVKENENPSSPACDTSDRQKIAAAIDEEDAYVYLHGYLAYKMLYKTYMVTSENMMRELFSKKTKTSLNPHIDLTFEDIFINFPDSSSEIHYSKLQARDDKYEKLKDVKERIFITVGHKHVEWTDENIDYLYMLKKENKTIKTIYKPSGGIYNLLQKSNLLNKYLRAQKDIWKKATPKIEKSPGHSAPGKLLKISESLINRAEKIYHEAKTVQDCIHGATLVLEAKEILNYKTPTTCLEAIAVRHKLEVKAECMFYGVEYNIDVKNRFKEIEGEINTVSNWFRQKVKKNSSLNARMSIVTEIMRIFKDYGQFDEEQECLVYLRKLNRKWYFSRHPQLKFLQPFRSYIETLAGSFSYFVIAILFWPLLGGIISKWSKAAYTDSKPDLSWHLVNSISTFYGIQPAQFPTDTAAKIITVILIFGGFIHLGIFLSYLYTLITRGK